MNLPAISSAVLNLLLLDLIFLAVVLLVVAALSRTKRAAFAVMKRNFVGYFSNPTGYVFLCIFVFLTSLAAFWPYEFFNQNLATLDQLNYWYPLIMLVFIPAITMSIWAEEKRQGTDELLLTLPADDFDIVIGKYMAAAAIFTASLLFSQLSSFMTLAILTEGSLDTGLIFTTYLGYWFVGLTMIAIGMIASFLTGNLTVGFILGSLFNAPLAFASLSKAIVPQKLIASVLTESGIARPFDDFGRGVISLSSVIYFLLAAVVALYVCMVLIGRRHWTGGKDGNTMAWHYIARTLALVLITGGAVVLFRNWDFIRHDATEGKVSSLAPATKKLIRELDAKRPIVIDAFISADVPEQYARTRYELLNLLKEFRSEASTRGRTIEVNLYDDIELFSDEAALAQERFGIEPVTRLVREKGSYQEKQLILGAAFKSGLEKVTIPVFEYGVPVEYELVRSINTVARGERKRVGIVATDARLMGGTVMSGMSFQQVEKHPLVGELEKQYEVEAVDFSGAVLPGQYDALVAVQPSSLAPEQFSRFVDAVKAGVPTAIFEDPLPFAQSYIPGTGEPKQAPGGFMGGGGPVPKGDIRQLWEALELDVPGKPSLQTGTFSPALAWQQYNPYPNLEMNVNDLWVFVDSQAPGAENALSDQNPITSGLREVLALYTGVVSAKAEPKLKHTPLLTTGALSGRLDGEAAQRILSRESTILREEGPPEGAQTIAMAIEGESTPVAGPKEDAEKEDSAKDAEAKAEDKPAETAASNPGIKVIYTADTDLMLPVFLQLRAEPNQAQDLRFQFQNVTYLLNTIDYLTGELDFLEVRKHEPIFSSLRLIDAVKEEATSRVRQNGKKFQDEFDNSVREAQEKIDADLKALREEMENLQKQSADGKVSRAAAQEKAQQFAIKQEQLQRALDVKRTKFENDREKSIREIRREADQEVTKIQNSVKAAAVALPCIPPLIIGVVVFASRRLRERENISKSRLK
jgi:ABC-2 type transport system permease protein